MRILQLGKFYPIAGGVEKVMWNLAQGLSARGMRCDMLCCGLRRELKGWNVGYHKAGKLIIPFNESGHCIVVKAVVKLAGTMISLRMVSEVRRRRGSYDVIHIHHPDPMAAMALFMSGYKGKVVLHWHSDILRQKGLLKLFDPFQRWLIRRADVIVGTTPVYVRESEALANVQDKIDCIPIGVDPVKPDSDGAMRVRSRFPGKKIVYSLGRLVPYKGYEYLIEAASYLPDDYHVLIGGGGPDMEELSSKIKEMGLVGKVTMLGRVPDEEFSAYFNACDLFALSSIYKTEAFAIVQIEAMSCGKPVVATRIPGSGVSWVNQDGVSGLNVEPRDARGMAEAIVRITSDRDVYDSFSARARARYEEMFTYDAMITSCMKLYNRLLCD